MARATSVVEERWDYLVVLDGCRFDYFQRVYRNYLHGDLREIRAANHTLGWLKKNFAHKKFSDIVYVSANPYINSKGIGFSGFNAKDHFGKILDVWDFGWDEKAQTVPPHVVFFTAEKAIRKFKGKRFIIHFNQPHSPFLTIGPQYDLEDLDRHKSFMNKVKYLIVTMTGSVLGPKSVWRMRGILRLPQNEYQAVAKVYGKKGLCVAYEENLRLALKYVSKLTENLNGKTIVTADHGDMLGEEGLYGHEIWFKHPLLSEVPWLDVIRKRIPG